MMILAWICFVPTALLFARFLRGSWALIKPAGIQIWFHVFDFSLSDIYNLRSIELPILLDWFLWLLHSYALWQLIAGNGLGLVALVENGHQFTLWLDCLHWYLLGCSHLSALWGWLYKAWQRTIFYPFQKHWLIKNFKFRCQPNTPNRPIFNWIHRGVGVVAYILASKSLFSL